MTDVEIKNYAAILTAGMLARDHESIITAEEAVQMMCDVADALRSKLNDPEIDSNYGM